MRVVLDSNVLIAAAASRGLCEAVFELCLERHRLILCDGLLAEVEEKLKHRLRVPQPAVTAYLKLLRRQAEEAEPDPVDPGACRDPDDLMILGLAAAGKADVIVTGDKDLLTLHRYRQTAILTPRSFWELNQNPE